MAGYEARMTARTIYVALHQGEVLAAATSRSVLVRYLKDFCKEFGALMPPFGDIEIKDVPNLEFQPPKVPIVGSDVED